MDFERESHSAKERGRTAAESIVLFMLLGAVLALATYMTKDVYESVTVSREIAKFIENPQERGVFSVSEGTYQKHKKKFDDAVKTLVAEEGTWIRTSSGTVHVIKGTGSMAGTYLIIK